jgi:hypothetical protein
MTVTLPIIWNGWFRNTRRRTSDMSRAVWGKTKVRYSPDRVLFDSKRGNEETWITSSEVSVILIAVFSGTCNSLIAPASGYWISTSTVYKQHYKSWAPRGRLPVHVHLGSPDEHHDRDQEENDGPKSSNAKTVLLVPGLIAAAPIANRKYDQQREYQQCEKAADDN